MTNTVYSLPLIQVANEINSEVLNKLKRDKKFETFYDNFDSLNDCIFLAFSLLEKDRKKANLPNLNYTPVLRVFFQTFDNMPETFQIDKSDLELLRKYLTFSIIIQHLMTNRNLANFIVK